MPQGRRKTPFSGKAKKEQIQNKRNRVQNGDLQVSSKDPKEEEVKEESTLVKDHKKQGDKSSLLMDVTFSSGAKGRGKYDLVFQKESKLEINERREMARKPYKIVDEKELEKSVDEYFPSACDYPKRPDWEKNMSKGQVEANEAKYFRDYVADVMSKHEQNLSYFELNIEVRFFHELNFF